MDYLQNHCWCSKSHWDNKYYDCRHLVSLKSYIEYEKKDWDNITTTEKWFNEEDYKRAVELAESVEGYTVKEFWYIRDIPALKPEVLVWLDFNVEDRKGEDNNKGWCIGNSEYRANDGCGMSIFFHRRKDAIAFIRQFSVYKKPVNYCQYFKDIRKKLNLETMKYETRK